MCEQANLQVHYADTSNPFLRRYADIVSRQVKHRCLATLAFNGDADPDMTWEVDGTLGEETFAIDHPRGGCLRIRGGTPIALLWGIGKFLRTSRYTGTGMVLSNWRGETSPSKTFRCVYFASHFSNFYQEAPLEVIERYVEELALWGFNMVGVWFDYHQFDSFSDLAAQKTFKHICGILRAVNGVGLKTAVVVLANEAYRSSPRELRAEPTGRSHYGVELCPHKDGAIEQLMAWFAEEFQGYLDQGVQINHVSTGCYDQGGCGCAQCRPWGANGYLLMSEKISRLARKFFPECTFNLNTWLFDYGGEQGEWRGLTEAFKEPPDWVDLLQAGAHGRFPTYPLEHGVPGGLPMFDFPEISMWNMYPWPLKPSRWILS